jgi:hypothetical protein
MIEATIREVDGRFATRSRIAPQGATVALSGEADMDAIQPLGAFLGRLHEAALAAACRRVEIQMQELRFMNSSCLREFVVWISKVQQLGPDRRYTITFVTNPERPSQGWSVAALKCLAEDIVRIGA